MRFAIKSIAMILISVFMIGQAIAQKPDRDKGKVIESKNEFWNEIKKSADEFNEKKDEPRKAFKMDFSGYDLPTSTKEFKQYWHNEPVSQGRSGMCWCYSTTSLLESEAYRLHKKKVKISELHTVYWEYVEKARRFVRERGDSKFAEGSQANAVLNIWKKYGCVPAESYAGLKKGQKFHDHSPLYNEMMSYLNNVKSTNAWNEELVLSTIKSILNNYIGTPPAKVKVGSKEMTPIDFMKNEVKVNPDDYIDIMSLMQHTYYEKAVYDVPDNWWKSGVYNNIPLDEYMETIKKSVEAGYTLFIGGDVSSSGYESHAEVAMVPSYDIPSDYIDENARQLRFSNKSTTDDHGIHIVGYLEKDGDHWFLIKDSGSGARNGLNKGYYFYHEDYVKLKMMNFMVHRSAVEDILKKMK